VIFAWNRIGLDARTQSILARAARDTAMSEPPRSSRTAMTQEILTPNQRMGK
jgi:hypothetical protein